MKDLTIDDLEINPRADGKLLVSCNLQYVTNLDDPVAARDEFFNAMQRTVPGSAPEWVIEAAQEISMWWPGAIDPRVRENIEMNLRAIIARHADWRRHDQ